MLEQAIDFKEESDSLYEILINCKEENFLSKTQFKSWTINDVIYHLHVWNIAATLSLKNEQKFKEFMDEYFPNRKTNLIGEQLRSVKEQIKNFVISFFVLF